ncbi:MAG: NADH-quinone oxidoreductase subunit J [Crocinitomicaceae bacterium]|nr:NADH-quinone oxidoreductase subunit J [Crocinitomicaceae bacterium]NCA21370.1 NADH-quinone oxidoreductase subunit J [Crocinitomicaceae bacterium]
MSLSTIAIILGGLTVASALMVIITKHPVHSVLYLILTFFMISSNYVLMNAQFLAVVNIIVYAGAIMVLFLFVLMLLNLSKSTEPQSSLLIKVAGVIAGGILLTVVVAALKDGVTFAEVNEVETDGQGLVQNLGKLLFTKYVLPFEMSSVLFIASIVGAVLLGKREKQIID